ncbi:hypothetical protein ID866_10157 [Astraeus odoratus]|nr:hypothetical protein ID866_10157 [Astraeus odoratus]
MQEVLHHKSIQWRSSQQQAAMMAILQYQTDTIIILPTGGGKSMLAIIPSLLETHMVTILMLPLNSLVMDYEQCLKSMAVPYQVDALGHDLNTTDNLILVSADKSQTTHWHSALANLGQ